MGADCAPNVMVEAMHEQSLVGRLAVLLNAHDVATFSYCVDPEGRRATAEICVLGGDRQVRRVASRLRRVIGVHNVEARLAGAPFEL